MKNMSKRERLEAAIVGEPVDRDEQREHAYQPQQARAQGDGTDGSAAWISTSYCWRSCASAAACA